MSRTKIDYGIDLGTTNSALARMEQGNPKIRKTDTLKDTMPSCIGFNKRQSILAGDTAWNQLKQDKLRALRKWDDAHYNTFIEFKRTMGSSKQYHSSNMDREYNSEELSAEILKKLRSLVIEEDFRAAVITVPAKFDIRQKDATLRAARLAGFQHCELLQEPIAASMSYGINSPEKNGHWLVFDFGGGTFDAALIRVEEGIMKVIDTDGDNYLGGKNLDLAIVNEIIIPYLKDNYRINNILADKRKHQMLQEAMKYYAEEAKIQLSFNAEAHILSDLGDIPGEDDDGEEFELDISVDQEQLKAVIAPIYQKAIAITLDVLHRNNLTGNHLDALILVGGPTYSPILRAMLTEQVREPDTSTDPMTAVATGAALYASTIDLAGEVRDETRDATKIQLDIGHEPSTVEMEEWVTLKFLPEKTDGEIPAGVMAEIVRDDQAWSSGKVAISAAGELVEVELASGRTNSFKVQLSDTHGNPLPCEPDRFNIIQGSVVGNAVLPYNIGLEIVRRRDSKLVFKTIRGLEINQTLPAKGTVNGLKTQTPIRPGSEEDAIKIPIYQGDYYSEGTRAVLNEHVYSAIITGDDLPSLLPQASDVDLTISTDKSGRIEAIEAYFPYLDYTVDINIPAEVADEVDAGYLENEIRKAKGAIVELRGNDHVSIQNINEVEEDVDGLAKELEQGAHDFDRKKQVLERLRKSLKRIDALNEGVEWPQLEAMLDKVFADLEVANLRLGTAQSTRQVEIFRTQLNKVKSTRDLKTGRLLKEQMEKVYFMITMLYQLINFIKYHDQNFHTFNWKDGTRARSLLDEGKRIIDTTPTEEQLNPIVQDIVRLLPDHQQPSSDRQILIG